MSQISIFSIRNQKPYEHSKLYRPAGKFVDLSIGYRRGQTRRDAQTIVALASFTQQRQPIKKGPQTYLQDGKRCKRFRLKRIQTFRSLGLGFDTALRKRQRRGGTTSTSQETTQIEGEIGEGDNMVTVSLTTT